MKHFQFDVEKGFINFQCRTVSLCKEFTVQIFECDISQYRNFGAISISVKRFGNKIFNQWKF